jgi:hypothetical protein
MHQCFIVGPVLGICSSIDLDLDRTPHESLQRLGCVSISTTIRHHSNSIVLDGRERVFRNLSKSHVSAYPHAANPLVHLSCDRARNKGPLEVAFISFLRLVHPPLRTITLPAASRILRLPRFGVHWHLHIGPVD